MLRRKPEKKLKPPHARLVTGPLLVALAASVAGCGAGGACQALSPTLAGMHRETIVFSRPGASPLHVEAWIADEAGERRAGFQHVCPETIAARPLWFAFERPVLIGFHMRNVHAPLDVAFIDAQGRLFEIRRMEPAPPGRPGRTITPSRPITAAVEGAAGWFERHGIRPGARATRTGRERAQ